MSGAGGKVVEVNAREGQRVKKGDLLLRFDTEQLDLEIAKVVQKIDSLTKELAQRTSILDLAAESFQAEKSELQVELKQALWEVEQARKKREGEIELANVELDRARMELRRMDGLDVAAKDVDAARMSIRTAEARLAMASSPIDESRAERLKAQLNRAQKQFDLKSAELELSRDAVATALDESRKSLQSLNLQKEESAVYAHVDGIVTVGHIRVGQLFKPGERTFAIAQEKGLRIDLSVSTSDIADVAVGKRARIKLYAFDEREYGVVEGTVYEIAPDSAVVEGRDGSMHVYYLVRVRLDDVHAGRGELRKPVQLGMMGEAEILTGEKNRLCALLIRNLGDLVSISDRTGR
jgi:multidrug resistance efflux pump